MFSDETPLEECLVSGYPEGDSYPDDVKKYARAVPPEVTSGKPYDPFKLDVWQFGKSLENFKVPDHVSSFHLLLLKSMRYRALFWRLIGSWMG